MAKSAEAPSNTGPSTPGTRNLVVLRCDVCDIEFLVDEKIRQLLADADPWPECIFGHPLTVVREPEEAVPMKGVVP